MRYRRFLALLAAPFLVGCSTLDNMMPDLSGIGVGQPALQPAKTTGLVVSDEPFAAQTGATILADGGSAVDAVSAMFFALSATYPVAAGLGGGGICLVRDRGGHALEYDFLAHAANGGGAFAVPGAIAGFYNMQKAFGTLPWQRDVAPGEAYAATGFPISHVLAGRLVPAVNVIRANPQLAAEFLQANGQLKPEGTVVMNRALSITLSQVRLSGSDGFYTGPVADGIVAASAAQGGTISAAELASYRSTESAARTRALSGFTAVMAGPGTGAGAFVSSVMGNVGGGDPANAVVVALRRSLAAFRVTAVPPDLGATGFSALDSNGEAASCAVTMNGPFGAGRTAGDTGVELAASPSSPTGISGAFLTPMIAADSSGQVALAGTGAGGPNGTAAIVYALLRLTSGQSLARRGDLRSTGLAPLVAVNAIACQNGLCVALPDPGGNGLGATVDQPVTN